MVSKRVQISAAVLGSLIVVSVVAFVATRPEYVLPDLALAVTSVQYTPSYSLQVNGEIGYAVPGGYKIRLYLVSLQDGDTLYDSRHVGGVIGPGTLGEGKSSWGMLIMEMITLESTTIQLTFNYTIQHIVSAELGVTEIVEEGSKTFTVNI